MVLTAPSSAWRRLPPWVFEAARASRDRRLSSSRRLATEFSRFSSVERENSGEARVTKVANESTATNPIRRLLGSVRMAATEEKSIVCALELEIDHAAHDPDAEYLNDKAGEQHQLAPVVGVHDRHVGRRGDGDQQADADRQRSNDEGRGGGLGR